MTSEEKFAICKECVFIRKIKLTLHKCKVCGCVLELKTKVPGGCPKNKW